jgi:hypothetical protein
MVITPVRLPTDSGVNVTEIVQVAGEGPSVVPQVLVWAKSPLAGEIVIGVDVVPVFFTVTVLAALVVPTAWEVNVSVVGVAVTTTVPALPVPVRLTVCGEFVALSETESVPVREPVVVGLNVTETVQFVRGLKVPVHGDVPPLATAKSPLAANEIDVLAVLLVFLMVTVLAALVVPTVWAANVSLGGVTVTVAGEPLVPVPERVTLCGEFAAWSAIEMLPDSGPAMVGVNVTLMVQLAPASNWLPQLLT